MMKPADLTGLLEMLCPMFVLVDEQGEIKFVGPTLQKLRPKQPMQGRSILDVFDLVRPRSVTTTSALLSLAGAKLHLKLKDEPRTALKGLIAPLPGGKGAIINLSFGISILDAVRDYALTSADFSGTDLAIELLYLVEAKSAAMEASRSLNLRLQEAMLAAELIEQLAGGHKIHLHDKYGERDRWFSLAGSYAAMVALAECNEKVNGSNNNYY